MFSLRINKEQMEKSMLSYLVHFLHAFISLSLLTGLLLALWRPARGEKGAAPLFYSLAAGLVIGAAVNPVALRLETATGARVLLFGVAAVAALAHAALLPVMRKGRAVVLVKWWGALFLAAALAAVAAYSFVGHVSEQALTAVTVLNTELILNVAGVLVGMGLMVLLVPVVAHLGEKSTRRLVCWLVLISSLLLVAQWAADVLLGLMRLEMMQLTSLRLSFVAKVTKYLYVLPYLQALLVALLSAAFFLRRQTPSAEELQGMQKAERRKARSRVVFELRWFKWAISSVCFVIAIFLYYDLHATRPRKITPPTMLTPDASGQIRIKIAQVNDGKLHRYAMVTDDGHVVRFFLVNRSLGQGNKIGVVYDACMLCGDMGYLQEKNEIICIACNVRIFLPSIGKAGGCNPIPLAHNIQGDEVVVTSAELDKGARYFSEVVSRKVKDPVSGKELESGKARYRHDYKGRTYFFESEESGEKFLKSPETYLGQQQSRFYRTDGFQSQVN